MATTYVGDGDRVTLTADNDYTAGDLYRLTAGAVGSVGVVVDTVASGATAVVALSGVWTVAKAAAGTMDFAVGEKVYMTSSGKARPTATGNTPVGIAFAAATTGATTMQVKLVQSGGLL